MGIKFQLCKMNQLLRYSIMSIINKKYYTQKFIKRANLLLNVLILKMTYYIAHLLHYASEGCAKYTWALTYEADVKYSAEVESCRHPTE